MRLLIIITLALFAAGCGNGRAQVDQPPISSNVRSLNANANAPPSTSKRDPEPPKTVGFGKWPVNKCGGQTLAWKAEAVDDPEEMYGRGVVFTLTGEDGTELFRETFTHFVRVYEKSVIPGCPAMFLEYNYGGTDNFLRALALEDGKVV